MNYEILIKLYNLSKRFKHKCVLNNINLDIYHGEILGIIGVSGAGKTTLLRSIIGFIKPNNGNAFIRIKPLLRQNNEAYNHFEPISSKFNKLFGFATQDSSFYPQLSVKENLFYFANLYNLTGEIVKKNAYMILKLVGLYNERDVLAKDLSQGMQKRLDIACAMIHNPRILILDEPTADLDPNLRRQILYLIRRINENGITVIISSHFFDEISSLCHRIAVLHNKQILAIGAAEELKSFLPQGEEIYLETFPGDYDNILNNLSSKNIYIESVVQKGNAVVLSVPQAELILPSLLYTIEEMNETVVNMHINKPTLNDVLNHIGQKNV